MEGLALPDNSRPWLVERLPELARQRLDLTVVYIAPTDEVRKARGVSFRQVDHAAVRQNPVGLVHNSGIGQDLSLKDIPEPGRVMGVESGVSW